MKNDRKAMCTFLLLVAMSLVQTGTAVSEDPPRATAERVPVATGVDHESGDPVVSDGETARRPVSPAAVALSPMMREIHAVLLVKRAEVAEAQRRFDDAADETDALRLQQEVETLKIGAELEILRIQVRYARLEGRPETAAALEASIEAMTAPRPRLEPRPESLRRTATPVPETERR